jgi:drug/metabolite transporter (DMT)-like permease
VSVSTFLIVLLAGLLHALWNIVAKKAGGDVRFACFSAGVGIVIWAPLGIWLGWDVVPQWDIWAWSFVVGSALLRILYFVVLLRGYRLADLTVVYPLARGTGPLLSSLAAIFWLGEAVSFFGIFGIACVIGGVFLIAGGPSLTRARLRSAGLRYGLLTGVLIACYTVVDGYAVKVLLLSPFLMHYVENVVRGVLLMPVVLRDRPAARVLWRQQWKYALLVGTITPVSYVLVLYALQTAPLSLVAPAREVSMLFAALIGGHLLGEGDRWLRVMGALLIACGVVMLGLA